jgi:energy-converting hydrogenase Eha subunit H
MARTTLAAVNKIIQYDSTNVPDPQLMIDSASLMVTNVIGSALDASTAELVERYLAAHLIAISDPRIQSEQVKTIQASYQVRLSDGLGITHFGSTAMMLDSSGKLAVWNNKVVKGMVKFDLFWAGKAGDTDVTY